MRNITPASTSLSSGLYAALSLINTAKLEQNLEVLLFRPDFTDPPLRHAASILLDAIIPSMVRSRTGNELVRITNEELVRNMKMLVEIYGAQEKLEGHGERRNRRQGEGVEEITRSSDAGPSNASKLPVPIPRSIPRPSTTVKSMKQGWETQREIAELVEEQNRISGSLSKIDSSKLTKSTGQSTPLPAVKDTNVPRTERKQNPPIGVKPSDNQARSNKREIPAYVPKSVENGKNAGKGVGKSPSPAVVEPKQAPTKKIVMGNYRPPTVEDVKDDDQIE